MKKNILVTGSKGQLGNELKKFVASTAECNWYFTDVDELNITDEAAVERFFSEYQIDICVNCAAYTAVDKAEDESEVALLINAGAVNILADATVRRNALLIHISTDYVFNGEHFKPYEETDPICPVSAYGKSKAEGEAILAKHKARHILIRTSWLYSAFGNNFVKTMIRLGKERKELKVVVDQIGTPTWAFDLAGAIVYFIENSQSVTKSSIYHYSNEGVISWYDFALAIMEEEAIPCNVFPIESKDYPVKTKRPFYSVLNKSKIRQQMGTQIPYWRDSLKKCLAELHVNG
ncbi:MAG: dTDP-4-dehydrorhamnose reductase [Bacteroidetes bacterium]|nr:dTDP-4-dehydrorhamnose reductase [Bacteroidota bacterium]